MKLDSITALATPRTVLYVVALMTVVVLPEIAIHTCSSAQLMCWITAFSDSMVV